MKKTFNLFLCAAFASTILYSPAARADDDMKVQMLEHEITKLKGEVELELAKLEKCDPKKAKNLMIAGGVLLGVATVGAVANVGLAVAKKKTDKKIAATKEELEALKAKMKTAVIENKEIDTENYSDEELEAAARRILDEMETGESGS